ncbi:MAG: hypothetical protein IKH65_02480, partial [Clostridia bacterium]|nr:hypothetical protein [Clostridia bacterium]
MKITKKVLLILLSLMLVLGAVAVGAMSVSAQTSCDHVYDVPAGELPGGTEKYYKVVAASAADGTITDVYIKAIKDLRSNLRIYESSDLQSLINGTVTVVSVNLTGSYTYNSGIETWTISIAGTGNYSSIDSLTPVLELPDNSYLEIGGVSAISGGEIKHSEGTGWSITVNEDGNGITLNLDDLDLTCDDNCISVNYLDLTITGSAKLTSTEATSSAINSRRGSLTLNGNFVLRAQSETGSALNCANGNLTVDGGSLDVINTADNDAIYVSGTMTVNGGHIYAESSDVAISANTLTVNGGSVYAKTENYVRAIYGGGIILNSNESFALGDKKAKEVLIKKSGELAGKGTEDFPYMICDYADLKLFASIVNGSDGQTQNSGACAKLMKDIDASASAQAKNWTPIGDGRKISQGVSIVYTGTFDGDGHIITGLTFNKPFDTYAGFFGCISTDGKVQNVGLEGGSITGANYVGGVVGHNSRGTITNCYNTGSVTATGTNAIVGGLVGDNFYGGRVTNCYNTGSVTATGNNNIVGGVVGENYYNDATVKNSYNTGSVTATGDNALVGGVVGLNDGIITNCYYDIDRCTNVHAIGQGSGTNVTGLTTAQMTGDDALSDSNMEFVYSTPEENPWLTKADEVGDDGAYYWFYPHLKGFNLKPDGTPETDTSQILSSDWPAKAEVTVTLSEYSFEYNGTPFMPTVTSVISGKTLEPNIDYTVSYYNAPGNVVYSSVNAGNYKAVVTFTDAGYAKGHTPIEKEFKITAKSITDDMIRLSQETAEYTGEEITPEVEVKDGATTLAMFTDYTVSYGDNNVDASLNTITVTGIGNYTGSVEKMFTITPKSITEDMITLSPDTAEYTGEAITPEVTVKDGDKTLSLVDYTVSYGVNNVDASDYTITVTGKGNYKDSAEKTFTI